MIAARNNYPPRSNQDLRSLWAKISESKAPDEQKIALLYYLLRDCRALNNVDTNFIRRTHLPRRWQVLVAGLWELDHAQFARALEHLTDPSLTPTFTDEILLTLLQHPRCDPSLAMAYYVAVSPPLQGHKTLEAYFEMLKTNNLVEAYYLAQKQPPSVHKGLFEKLVVSVLQDKPGHSRAERAALLVGLPLSEQEETWFEECLVQGAASKLSGAKDTIMARQMVTGYSTSNSSMTNRFKGNSIQGVNWDNVRSGIVGAVPR